MMINNMPKFSICIPTYNSENFIRDTIKSVLSQKVSDFELIIVDDCSQDNTVGIISEFDDPRIKLFKNDHNFGMVNNWNRCMELANGEIIWILHADDLMGPDALSIAESIFKSNRIGMLFGASKNFVPEENPDFFEIYKLDRDFLLWKTGKESIEAILRYGITCSTVSILKEVFLSLGGFDPRFLYSPDEEYYTRIAKYYPIAYTKDILAFRRFHEGNTMLSTWKKEDFYEQYSQIYEIILRYAIDVNINDEEIINEIINRPKKAIILVVVPHLLRCGERDLAKKYISIFESQIKDNHLKHYLNLMKILTYLPPSYFKILYLFKRWVSSPPLNN